MLLEDCSSLFRLVNASFSILVSSSIVNRRAVKNSFSLCMCCKFSMA
uniref:Uncharacterized protein n=1 Tax=Arundo donax TaxID=35708 RepID=A0A0A9DA75_ARUDO